MPDAAAAATPPLPHIPLKPPTFQWDGANQHEHFKSFSEQCKFLLGAGGPFASHTDQSKVAALLNWMGPKAYPIFNNADWTGKDKAKLDDVLDVLSAHFKPTQSVLQSWYQLGSVYSNQFKTQTEFLNKLKDVASECGFANKDEVTKFLFLIHNTNDRVKDYLIDKMKPDQSLPEILTLAKTVESTVETESLSKQLLQNVGKINQDVHAVTKHNKGKGDRNHSKSQHRGESQKRRNFSKDRKRSGSRGGPKCGNCGNAHPPKQCPAWGRECYNCKKKHHFRKCCKGRGGKPHTHTQNRHSRKDLHDVEKQEEMFEYDTDEIRVVRKAVKFTTSVFRSPKEEHENIMFDEISQTKPRLHRALTDLKLRNKAGVVQDVRFKLDTGASANLLPVSIWKEMFPNRKDLKSTIDSSVELVAANKSSIKQLGTVRLNVTHGNSSCTCLFYVVPNKCRPILGLPDLLKLKLVRFNCNLTDNWEAQTFSTFSFDSCEERNTPDSILSKEALINGRYEEVFQGLGRLPIDPVKIQLSDDAVPVQKQCRRVPIALKEKFKEELDNMERQGIISKLGRDTPTPWLNSYVIVRKPNGSLRICLDPTDLNQYIVRPVCNSHTFDEISYKLKDARVFSVFDATKGFFQLPLDIRSRLLTAMLTPEGVYVFNVLAMGLCNSTDLFESALREVLDGLEGVVNIADDILVYGKDQKEHDANVIAFLNRCLEVSLKLNPDKVKLNCTNVPFFGQRITKDGIKPDPSKVQSIKAWPVPADVKELQSFLGTVNFLSKFIPELSSLRQPLQNLVKKDSDFLWTDSHTQAFNDIKTLVSDDCLLRFYDPGKPLFIECDASKRGIGAVLLQPEGNMSESDIRSDDSGKEFSFRSQLRPVAYASKSMSEAETRYSNIERELLAVVFSIEHFKHFTFGRTCHIITDHKPLLPLFRGKALINTTPRLCRLLLRITDYNINIHYQGGKRMFLSDALSRLPNHNSVAGKKSEVKGLDVTVHAIEVSASDKMMEKIRTETTNDRDMQTLIQYITKGWPASQNECVESLRGFFTFRYELSVVDGLVIKGLNRIVIPKVLHDHALTKLHKSHLGATKTILRARTCVYWPGINEDITTMCSRCECCMKHSMKQQYETLKNDMHSTVAWSTLATDLFEFQGKLYLIVVDRYSKFIVVRQMNDHSANETVKAFLSIFSELGIPDLIRCDRGSNYTSEVFIDFCAKLGIQLSYSSAYHHSSNPAERAVRTVKGIMKKCQDKSLGNYAWCIGLLEYLCTPISDKLDSPAALLNHRVYKGIQPFLRNVSPSIISDSQSEELLAKKANEKLYHDRSAKDLKMLNEGSDVWYRQDDQWKKATVVNRDDKTGRSYTLVNEGGKIVSRNRVDLKPCHTSVMHKQSFKVPGESPPKDNVVNNRSKVQSDKPVVTKGTASTTGTAITVTRSGRVVKPPKRMDL